MNSSLRNNCLIIVFCGLFISASTPSPAMDSSTGDLIGLLKSPNAAARLQAIDQLGERGANADEAVQPLTSLLKNTSAEVRAHAARSLGKIGSAAKPAASTLILLLKDGDPSVRRQAVKALAAIRPGPKVMVPLFIKLMEDSDSGVQLRVLNAVTDAGEAAVPGLIEALKNDKVSYWACVVLREIGPPAKAAVPALAEKLKDPRPDIRMQAILALGAMNEAALPVVPQIVAALDDEHTRTAATFVLGKLGKIPADAERKIRSNANSDNRFLSTVSLWTLARVHPEDKALRRQATEKLVARLKDKDPFVRVMAARALAALPPAPDITIPIWEKAMENADATTVRHALDALAALGKPAVPRLVEILEKYKELRVEVVYTLGQMGPAAADATDALSKLVADENVQLATEAILALGQIGPAAKSAVPALCAAYRKKGEKNTHAIIFTFGNIGPQAAAAEPILLEAMKSKDKALAIIAARSFFEIQPPSAAAKAADKAVPVLVAGLDDELPETRKAAAESLAALGPLAREGIPALKAASKDNVKAVREATAKALKSIQ
ncbi:MAG: HEAT repeat domain-containing protein [Pirellulales bacterium]|nr:HEAT repeat domain-containing protein [Pirellulales bacterium]